MTRNDLLKRETAEYIAKVDMTQAERQELLDWTKGGNSVYDNPWHMADDNGRPMDYITAVRETDDMRQSRLSSDS